MTANGDNIDLSRAMWRKSSYSNGGEGACVEVAELESSLGLRDSKNPLLPHLSVATPAFGRFLSAVKDGRHDL